MSKTKNHYIKYSRAELENYTKQSESCVKKINCVEPIRFCPIITTDFQQSILRILSKKIGRFDFKLNGIVLDFRNTKILASQCAIRQDSPFTIINVAADFYVFSPQRGAIVSGTLKYINRMSMETIISVVIYRVFNVKVSVKGNVKQELERNSDIQIRVKDFHFDNVIPFIEGELIIKHCYALPCILSIRTGEIFDTKIFAKRSSKKLFEDMVDSGISESSITSEIYKIKDLGGPSGEKSVKIKQEGESSVESSKLQPEVKKKRKRKASNDTDYFSTPIVKRIKAELVSTDDELDPFQGISNMRFVDKPILAPTTKKKKHSEPLNVRQPSTSQSTSNKEQTDIKHEVSDNKSTSVKEKKPKKKKKRELPDDTDDFETSLQLLLNAHIKKEK